LFLTFEIEAVNIKKTIGENNVGLPGGTKGGTKMLMLIKGKK